MTRYADIVFILTSEIIVVSVTYLTVSCFFKATSCVESLDTEQIVKMVLTVSVISVLQSEF